MTGFASKTLGSIHLKIKSVNHRFFDLRLHGPQDLMVLDKEIRQKIGNLVKRGSLDVFIQMQNQMTGSNQELDMKQAKAFHQDLVKLASDLKLDLKNELSLILKYGAVFKSADEQNTNSQATSALFKSEFFKVLDQVLKDFEAERLREGKALGQELKALLVELENVRAKLESLAKDYPKELEAKIQDKLKIWTQEFDQDRLNQELLLLIDKSDIKEEIVRLKEHIKACLKLLSSPEAEGKKLDFYAQELFREVNTIGSKSSSVKITQEVMHGKSIIEKIRQQVQNIE